MVPAAPRIRSPFRFALVTGWFTLVLSWGAASPTASAAGLRLPWSLPSTLEDVAQDVDHAYPDVQQLPAEQLNTLRRSAVPLVLLDVRGPEEYAVSHLSGAIRVDPAANAEQVLAAIGPLSRGTQVVMYCSVGERSSRMAERMQTVLKARGAAGTANLRGGIFGWHNERRPLVDAEGPTDAVHGFNARWSRLLQRTDAPIVIPD